MVPAPLVLVVFPSVIVMLPVVASTVTLPPAEVMSAPWSTLRAALRSMLPPVLVTPVLTLIVRSLVEPVAVSVMWPGPDTCSVTVIDPPATRLIAPLAPVTSSPPNVPFTPPTVTASVSAMSMPPVAVAASRFVTLVSMSPVVPIPVEAVMARFAAMMFSPPAPSPARLSVIAPAVAASVTLPAPTLIVSPSDRSPVVVVIDTVSSEVVMPTVVVVPIASASASTYVIVPAVFAARTSTSLVTLVSANEPLAPVLSNRNLLPVIWPSTDCVAPCWPFRPSVTTPEVVPALMVPSRVIAPSPSVSPNPESKETLPAAAVARTMAVALMMIRSPASNTTSPPVDSTMTPALTVMLSVSVAALSVAVAVSVPPLDVFTANVIGLLAISVVVPVPTLLEVVSVPTLLIVRAPVLVIATLPDVVLLKARFVTAVSNASPLPMPVVADSDSDVAVMIVAEALASLIEPVAASSTVVPVLEPARSMLESSAMETVVPPNVRLPKFVSFPTLSPNVIVVVAVSVAKPVTPMLPAVPSEIVPVVLSVSEPAVLDPANSVFESSLMLTAPPDVTVSEPKFVVSPRFSPSVIDVPLNEAFPPEPATVRLVPSTSVSAPVDVSDRLLLFDREFVPVSCVSESSVMVTAPFVELNVRLPKLTVPAAATVMAPAPPSKIAVPLTLSTSVPLSARLIDVPVIDALPLSMVTLVPEASVTAPDETNVRLSLVLMPDSCVSESSLIDTAPPAVLNVRLPKFVLLPTSSPSVMVEPEKLALLVMSRSPVVPSVTVPVAETVRLPAVTKPSRAIAPAAFVRLTEVDAETVPVVRLPPPDWSNVTDPTPVVRLVAETAVNSALSKLIAPDVVSALIDVATNSSAVVLPIPVAAFRSTVAAVTRPAPLIAPAVVIVTVSSAVIVPFSVTSPDVTPLVSVMSAVLPTLSTARLPVFSRMIDPVPS